MSINWQQEYCLTKEHVNCPYYSTEAAAEERGGILRGISTNKREILALAIALAILLTAAAAIASRGASETDDSQQPGDNSDSSVPFISETASPTQDDSASLAVTTQEPTPPPTPGEDVEEQPTITAEPTAGAEFAIASDALEAVWNRLDLPVQDGVAERTWLWGPAPISEALEESYADAPGGERTVQYFDKSRMEINDPDADVNADGFVTTGLLVVEMVYGHFQIGDSEIDDTPSPADRPILDTVAAESVPTYADIQAIGLDVAEPTPEGTPITQTIVGGSVTTQEEFQEYQVVSEVVVELGSIEHAIASVFWDFMTSQGIVWQDGEFATDDLFSWPFFAAGYPITEAYWTTAELDGVDTDVLWQCFERRCLTYTPSNESGWQVEASNVGMHYYEWRYGPGS